ncbi:Methionyl-tRNA formyltransferase [Vermiconidia calcicola]|uniref:Methionyl-tRNA formyltransferase n=1 Tax=Vermiconidia calcicola TaxID=1690605 RepID=A0ACC3NBY2_9PEZI|nr:Methionyl-tRNA formyltransferase [Vermiconidia calcicola]
MYMPNDIRGTLSSWNYTKQHDPLNILFCGTDEFSIYSLRALHKLQNQRPEKIANIDVLCRPNKLGGRHWDRIHEAPIKAAAAQLGLHIHHVDNFKSWTRPKGVNLIVAVSFGLLVPARILNETKYGGLNVHPSLLPDLRGPAPIVHTLLHRREYTGTMHPTRFDHGNVLWQTPAPGFRVPDSCTPQQLRNALGRLSAEMLRGGIENGLFLPPLKDVTNGTADPESLDHAPKVTPEDRHIDWTTWTADEILLRDRVLGRLWDTTTYAEVAKPEQRAPKRVAFQGPWTKLSLGQVVRVNYVGIGEPGAPVLVSEANDHNPRFGIRTSDNWVVSPSSATIDGEKKGTGLHALTNRFVRRDAG